MPSTWLPWWEGQSHPPCTLGGKKVRVLSEWFSPTSYVPFVLRLFTGPHFFPLFYLTSKYPSSYRSWRQMFSFSGNILLGVRNHFMLTRQSLCLCFGYSRWGEIFQTVAFFILRNTKILLVIFIMSTWEQNKNQNFTIILPRLRVIKFAIVAENQGPLKVPCMCCVSSMPHCSWFFSNPTRWVL